MPPIQRVLVVEDDPGIGLILRRFFESRGCEVHMAGSGRAAFMRSSSGKSTTTIFAPRYDLITMDLMMPNWDGVQAIKAILRLTPEAQFIVISGVQDPQIREHVMTLDGVRCFVNKPFTRERLAEIVDRLEAGGDVRELSDA